MVFVYFDRTIVDKKPPTEDIVFRLEDSLIIKVQ